MTFRQDLVGEEDVRSGIYALSDSVAARLRRKNMKCTTVQILIKDPQFKSISRQKKLEKPTYVSRDIRNAAMELVKKTWNLKLPIRMMSVTGTNLVGENDVYEQMSLIEDNTENTKKVEQFEKTVDNLKNRFGNVVSLGGSIKKYEVSIRTVSYTHLDVYKRQILHRMQVVQWANILCIKARTF